MIRRCDSLKQALSELEDGALDDVTTIVVNRGWWDTLSSDTQQDFQRRCVGRSIELRADHGVPRHFVELIGGPARPPLSSERRV